MPLVISMLLSGQILALSEGALRGLVGLGSAAIALSLGNKASDMNKEYTRLGKKPDRKMERFKLFAGTVALTALEVGFSKNAIASTVNLVDLGTKAILVGVTSYIIYNNDTLAQFINDYTGPFAGFLAGPMDSLDGKEHKDNATLCRTLLVYVFLRKKAVNMGLIKDSSFKQKSSSFKIYKEYEYQ